MGEDSEVIWLVSRSEYQFYKCSGVEAITGGQIIRLYFRQIITDFEMIRLLLQRLKWWRVYVMWERGYCVERVGIWRRMGSTLPGFNNLVHLSTNNPVPSYSETSVTMCWV